MARPFEELRESGLLWLINRTVFHPRGFALGLVLDAEGHVTGWTLGGDGAEPWQFKTDEIDEIDLFRRAEKTLGGD
jgi:hypothetical protein